MRQLCLAALFFAASSVAFGQLDDNTLTVTASRSISFQPDQVVVGIYVDAPLNLVLDDILGALDGAGLTAADLAGVGTSSGAPNQPQRTAWTFTRAVPFSKLNATLATLTAIQQKRSPAGIAVTFFVQGSQVSPELQASQACPLPSLVSDTRAKAQQLAGASGFTVGPILSISDGSSSGAIGVPQAIYGGVLSASVPVAMVGVVGVGTFTSLISQVAPNCSMTVQFKLLH